MQVQVQVQPQQQIQDSTAQQNDDQQIIQVSPFSHFMRYFQCFYIAAVITLSPHQVQIGQQPGQMLGQVLQVPSGSHQQLQGVTTAQLIQPGDLTEEQQQQV